MSEQEKETKEELFPFEYVGGGYFRRKDIPKGQVAETLHGMEAIKYLLKKIKSDKQKS